MKSQRGTVAYAAILVLLLCLAPTSTAQDAITDEMGESVEQVITPEQLKFFETNIRPVMIRECYGCHSNQSGQARGGLRLDTRSLTHLGGDSGPGIVPGNLEESLIYNAITHTDFVMPPKRKLSDREIADFREWIEMGAPDPRVTKIAEIKSQITSEDIQEAKESFWAYKPTAKTTTPVVNDASWSRTDIDRHVLGKLESVDLQPAPDAPSYKILRRLCFDIVGLPPTPQQITWFEKAWQSDPDQAIATTLDRLLEKEQFGERWGRHWLDVARYGESTGREVNTTYPHAWRYRDYVIDSFNDDKPFDRFIQEQIAGDLLPVQDDQQWTENLIATTFLAMGTKNVNEQSGVQFNADLIDEQIDTTTRVFLGTSVACARCHDHKFDPIRQTDYYAMAGIFASTKTYFGNPPSKYGTPVTPQSRRISSLILLPVQDPNPFDKSYTASELEDLHDQMRDLQSQLANLRRDSGSAQNGINQRIRIGNQMAEVSAKLGVVDENGNPLSYCMGVQDSPSPRDARVLVRGEIDQPAQVVPRGIPDALSDQPLSIDADESGRLELARWIASPDNPLTARVMVNRIWKHLLGQGLVTSTENFGATGTAPSHPELLDHLAIEFVNSGWSVKSLIRRIVTSRVYRMDTTFDQRSHQYDPDNALLWHANAKRLDAESLRDAMLSICGELDTQRPRGSDVAQAGYMRVRGETLADPREMVRTVTQEVIEQKREEYRERIGEAMRQRFAQRGGTFRGRPGPSGRPSQAAQAIVDGEMGRQMQRETMQAVAEQVAKKVSLDKVDANYRSVYLPIVRDLVPRSLDVFDFADASMVIGDRESSNTPNQALYMMNNPLVLRASESFAERLTQNASRVGDQITQAFLLAYGRPPTAGEKQASADFLRSFSKSAEQRSSNPTGRGDSDLSVMAAFCQSLFAAAEFRYLD
ncbi:PSD1 and planctomycete cytochrome C domain-containing protein [Stieleria varia]|uniref:PSD1 and planctomycete cytochrome C domain-containing protein n=1 Tax=Stieleria varia TaxID=2528005 RepID=UPI001E2C7AC3|nr:PSD1 and planctomycete cytochrome C domain-containing protein [Stieleria varia]